MNNHPIVYHTGISGFQLAVYDWVHKCVGPEYAKNKEERCLRALEENVELVQALDLPYEKALAILNYVYSRPKGDPQQECGGSFITLAALASTMGIRLDDEGNKELRRCWENIEKIRSKTMAKDLRGEGLK